MQQIALLEQGRSMAVKSVRVVNHALFEEDFVLGTLGRIGHDPYTALTELVANAWDAGASKVSVSIPYMVGGALVVEDDGHGMATDMFHRRWMTLGYSRAKGGQGDVVQFPAGYVGKARRAFGRNGKGRHGLLCFSDTYEVETWADGILSSFTIATRNQPSPFFIKKFVVGERMGNGTRLSVGVERHLPDPEKLRDVLCARFLHDPEFVVTVNGHGVPLRDHKGFLQSETLKIGAFHEVVGNIVDTTRTAGSTRYQGIAFWVNNRLVGEPSWVVGSAQVLDGRTRFAKRYALVIQAGPGWLGEVEGDWSRFKRTDLVDLLFQCVAEYARRVFDELSAEFVDENSEDALYRNREDLRTLSTGSVVEVAQFTQALVHDQPGIPQETLNKAVKAIIQIQKARSGAGFLNRLLALGEDDVNGLERMLSQWSVQDALLVLDEIDGRLSVISAIEKLCGDPGADELHTLHPLVTQARWLFGPEFDSSEFTFNRSLMTVAHRLFKATPSQVQFYTPAKRPDLVALPDSTIGVVATDRIEGGDGLLTEIRQVLLIELKKGRSTIGRTEMNQAIEYVEEFLGSGIDGTPFFSAFVVGHQRDAKLARAQDIIPDGHVVRGRVVATTYDQLARTARKRLHGLRERLPSRYDDVSGYDLVKKVMGTVSQAQMLTETGDVACDQPVPLTVVQAAKT